MPLSPEQQAAKNRLLNYYDGDAPYDPAANPGGFRRGGNVPNFEPALKDVAVAAEGVGTLVGDAQAAAGATETLRNQAQAAVASGRVAYDTLAQLQANLSPADGAQGEVRADPNPASNGTYDKMGASGSGSWVQKSQATVPSVDARTRTIENRVQKRTIPSGVAVTDERGNAVLLSSKDEFRASALRALVRRYAFGFVLLDERLNALLRISQNEFRAPGFWARVRRIGSGFAISDAQGNALLKAMRNGASLPGLQTRVRRLSGEGAAITDQRGNSLIEILRKEIRHPAILALKREGQRTALGLSQGQATPWPTAFSLADALQIMIDGQSLSIGWLSQPVYHTLPLPYADRFNGGVRATDGGSDAAVTHASLTGLFEQASGNAYESPATACARMIAQLLRDENGVDIASAGPRLLLSTPGRSGATLAELSSGELLQRVYDDIDYGQSLSAAAGRTVNLGAFGFTQGETEYLNDTDPVAWAGALRTFCATVESRANTAGGLSRSLPVFLTQTATHLNYGRATPGIALQQLALADEARFCFVTPMHFLRFVSDRVHLTNVSSMHLGAFYGLAIKRAAIDGVKIRPLVPEQAQRNGPSVILNFPNALGGLVFDTATCPNPGNFGFTLAAPDGADIPVTSVKIVGPNTIVLRAGSALPANVRVRHAWIGDGYRGLGNLRDRQGEGLIFDPTGLRLPMHRFAPIFERTVA
ncbi:hypothetical protein [Methylorubrum aminovorans]|uniref:hypothetical protein n=1 Tax=Methylorubrum aminovorans TaxID=269069 RepID=UPI003C30E18D